VGTSNDPFALATGEAIVLDGPNGVSGAPRQHFPDAAWSGGLGALALVMALLAARGRRGRLLLAGCLGLAALPGLYAVLVLRGDAPAQRGRLATTLTTALAQLQPHTGWPSLPATVTREDDDVLFPLLRYAMPTRPAGGATTLEVRGGSLEARCEPVDGGVVCGAGP
jgi:hypothetical protein